MKRRSVFGAIGGAAAFGATAKGGATAASPRYMGAAGSLLPQNLLDPPGVADKFYEQMRPIERAYEHYWSGRHMAQSVAAGQMDLDLMALRSVPMTQKIRMQRERDEARHAEHESIRNRIRRALGIDG